MSSGVEMDEIDWSKVKMKHMVNRGTGFWMYLLAAVMIALPVKALSEETYKFERMWPTLQQPWYFAGPTDIAMDSGGYIYVCDGGGYGVAKLSSDGGFISSWRKLDTLGREIYPSGMVIGADGNAYCIEGDRVMKFTLGGELVMQWGRQGSGDREFNYAKGIAISSDGDVYVTDCGNQRIQKFTSQGVFVTKWGTEGNENGEFKFDNQDIYYEHGGIAVDFNGNVYVADTGNHRIQKFASDGSFLSKWGTEGNGDGQFLHLSGIEVGGDGKVYVLDSWTQKISVFSAEGQFLYGFDTDSHTPCGIFVDTIGHIYISDLKFRGIWKFTLNGELVASWTAGGSEEGKFYNPNGVVVDADGNVLVADMGSDRIQKFTSDGHVIETWPVPSPCGIARASNGDIFVASFASQVFRLNAKGETIDQWGSPGTAEGQFNSPYGIAVDRSGNVYVADQGNHNIQKFNSDSSFVTRWGEYGDGDGQFADVNSPTGLAVDPEGNVYACDPDNNRIQKFSSEGQFLTKWEVSNPYGIAVDGSGSVYLACFSEILKLSPNGDTISKWGEFGSAPGQMNGSIFLAPNEDQNRVYVVDTVYSRVQVFSKEGALPVTGPAKTIIVAGGGPYAGNNLWDATEMCANYAYRAMTYQGYTKDTIYYLSADTDLDLDGNGKLDDVDADATNANLQYAINTWASDADNLLVYMVDHGGNGTFRMSGTELLYATELDGWLDTLQQKLPGHVTLIYDACESGSFLPFLIPPAGKQRYVAASTSLGEESIFVGNGTVSFSFLFWGHMFNGNSFYNSFVNAQKSVSTTYNQTCQLDANGNGIGNEKEDKDLASQLRIGNETKSAGDVPVIGGVSPAQTLDAGISALLYAEQVIDADGISRVWAVITPPGYSAGGSDTPVTDLPTLDLNSAGNNRYEASYTNFTTSGTYNIAVFAMDRKGVLSLPVQTTVNVGGADSCLSVASDLSIQVPCAEYDGIQYGFLLDFYPNPDDLAGLYWKMVLSTVTQGQGDNCLQIGEDLSMPVPCASYNGTQFGFTLDFYPNPSDPSGIYWKMDFSTAVVK